MRAVATRPKQSPTQRVLIAELESKLEEVLPAGFTAEISQETLTVTYQGSVLETFSLIFAGSLDNSSLFSTRRKFEEKSPRPKVLAARYISEPARETLRRQEISYFDATGNISLIGAKGKLLMILSGLGSDPWRSQGRPRLSFRGDSVQAIARHLIEHQEPFSTTQLIRTTAVPRGSAYRAIQLIEDAGLITRNGSQIVEIHWEELLATWSAETGFSDSGFTKSYSAPNGFDQLLAKLKVAETQYVASGTIASVAYQQSANIAVAMLYSQDPDALALDLGLEESKNWANVIINFPKANLPYRGGEVVDDIRVTSIALTYRDLMSGPGRNPEEAQHLLRWMRKNVGVWRR